MEFYFEAKDHSGNLQKGLVSANDANAATLALKDQGYYILEVRPDTKVDIKSGEVKVRGRKVTVKDKIMFTEQLSIMIRSGLSLIDALNALYDEISSPKFKRQISEVITDVKGGTTFSEALSKFPGTFSETYINMTKSGEESGKLEEVLDRLASQLEKEYELNRKIRGALSYPIFVMCALVCVMVLVLTVIIPQLKSVFDDAGVELPLLTRIIIGLSLGLKTYGIFLFAALGIAFMGCYHYAKTKQGRYFFDRMILKIPVFSQLLKKSYMARFTRTFSSLIASGLPLISVFHVSGKVIGNVIYEDEINAIADKVQSGHPISLAFKESKVLPQMVGQLSIVGEKSGAMDEVFDTLADFFDRDVDTITANLSTMLEPILMVVMGAGIGLIIIAVLQPIYGLVNAI